MALILNYKLDETNSVDIGTEYVTGTDTAVNNNVTSTTDATYGTVAEFNGTNSSLLIQNIPTLIGNSSRTYSFWVSTNDLSSNTAILATDSGSDWRWVAGSTNSRWYTHTKNGSQVLYTQSTIINTWYHFVSTYDSSTSLHELYIDGVFSDSATNTIVNGTGDLSVGNINYIGSNSYDGLMLDLRIYDDVLSSAEISTLFSDGPNPIPPPTATPWSTFIELSWGAVAGATSYRIVYDSGTLDVSGDTDVVVHNLVPSTLYTFQLYVSSDDVNYTFHQDVSETTLSDTLANANLAIFLVNGDYDFTNLTDTTRVILQPYFDDIFSTGDIVVVNTGPFNDTRMSVVATGTTSTIPEDDPLLLTFDPADGASQSATLQLENLTNVLVTYDETTNDITVSGVTYSDGDSFVLNGKKVTVRDI